MLYDQSQPARACLHAWHVTGNQFFPTITEEILEYVAGEMTCVDASVNTQQFRHAPGPQSNTTYEVGGVALYSTQAAVSEGVESKFFVWTPDEIHEVLGDAQADAFMDTYGVTRHGNFEGRNILEFVGDKDQRPSLAEARHKLFQAREKRVHPGRDDVQLARLRQLPGNPADRGGWIAKVLTSGNGLMLPAVAEAARFLNRDDYRKVAEGNAGFLLRELRRENGRLLRTWKSNPELGEGAGEAKLNGYLEDYAYLIEGLLELYQTTFESKWFVAAQELAEAMIEHYADSDGTFFDTSDDHETLITRPRDLQDNATPSGNAMAVTALLKLAGFTNELRYVDIAHQTLAQMQPMMSQYPLGFGQWLQALSYTLAKPKEIAIVGDPDSADTRALLNVVRNGYRPFQVIALAAPERLRLAPTRQVPTNTADGVGSIAPFRSCRIEDWWRDTPQPTCAAVCLPRACHKPAGTRRASRLALRARSFCAAATSASPCLTGGSQVDNHLAVVLYLPAKQSRLTSHGWLTYHK